MAKISSRQGCAKMENNSTMEKVLLACDRNAKLLRLIGATFDFKVDEEEKFDNSEKFAEKSLPLFVCHC